MNGAIMYFLAGECPICNSGTRGFRLCSDQQTVVIMCDECDSVWLDARCLEASDVIYPTSPHFLLPGQSYGVGRGSRWATKSEISAASWANLISGEGGALDGD
jgi:hypothetical protein